MNLSVIIPVLNSHEIVRRQILHFEKLDLSGGVEIFIMDDGSDPPLKTDSNLKNLIIYPTNDFRPWSEEEAKNTGAKMATGRNLIMIDADHVLTQDAIDSAVKFTGDRMAFRRKFGILTESGDIDESLEAIKSYGVAEKWLPRRGLRYVPGHRNNFCMSKKLFDEIGGYPTFGIGRSYPYGGGPDSKFYSKFRRMREKGLVKQEEYTPTIYFIPNGKYCGNMNANPFGLFHNLNRKSGNFKSNFQS